MLLGSDCRVEKHQYMFYAGAETSVSENVEHVGISGLFLLNLVVRYRIGCYSS